VVLGGGEVDGGKLEPNGNIEYGRAKDCRGGRAYHHGGLLLIRNLNQS